MSHTTALLLSNSAAGQDRLREDGLRCQSFQVIENGIDIQKFNRDVVARHRLRTRWSFNEELTVIGIVARPVPVKDLGNFIRAAGLVAENHPQVRFAIVGGRDCHAQFAYRQLAKDEGVDELCRWESDRADMNGIYSAIDILCLSSISEGFPNVIAEAMACGTPCVATDVGAVSKIIGELGIVVRPASAQALAQGLSIMLDRLPSIDRRKLRQSIESRYSLQRCVEAYEVLFERLLTEH